MKVARLVTTDPSFSAVISQHRCEYVNDQLRELSYCKTMLDVFEMRWELVSIVKVDQFIHWYVKKAN